MKTKKSTSSKKNNKITISEAVFQVLEKVRGPIEVKKVVSEVLKIRPSQAKKPAQSILADLRVKADEGTVIYQDSQTIIPIRVAMKGVRFRIPIEKEDLERGSIFLKYFDPFLPSWAFKTTKVIDSDGNPLQVNSISHNPFFILPQLNYIPISFSMGPRLSYVIELDTWFKASKAKPQDSILATFEKCFPTFIIRLEHEPKKNRKLEEIKKKDQELGDRIFEILENSRDEWIDIPKIILPAYISLKNPTGYPGSYWGEVVNNDPRLTYGLSGIGYAKEASLLDSQEKKKAGKKKSSSSQKKNIYCFKAYFEYNPSIWRKIEIRGNHTLAQLDQILRKAFQHEKDDHLCGFWKKIRRGKTNRFREIELATIDFLGEGEGASLQIGELDLKPGDQLKYVYDFGDWVEHTLVLEEITSPSKKKYPCIVEKNKPRYKYCVHCKEKNRRKVATWICIECLQVHGKKIVTCEECMKKYHEDHYGDYIVY